MSQKELDRYEITQKTIKKEITGKAAAELLSLSYRQFKRIKAKIKENGAKGLIHGNKGRKSNNKIPETEYNKIVKLISEKYSDFGPTLVTEKLEEKHKIKRDVKSIRSIMTKESFWKPKKKKKSGYHSWRKPKDCLGEMSQFDGSYEFWFEDRGPYCCLLLAVDDAMGKILHAEFAPDEGVMSVFSFWKEYILKNGCPRSIYLDKFSTYRMTQKNAKNNHDLLTQFQRACNQLGIESISANTPQAKGRVERMFRTLQDRLIKELRLANVNNIEDGNKFLEEIFIPDFNKRFGRQAASKANLHKKLKRNDIEKLPSILSRQNFRVVQNDFTISFNNTWYQLLEKQAVTIRKQEKIKIEEWTDGSIKFELRGKDLNVIKLTERPQKQKSTPWVLAKTKMPQKSCKPAKDHPWRQYQVGKNKSFNT